MALKEGKSNKDQNKNQQPQASNEELLKALAEMRAEMAELKANSNKKAESNIGGMSPEQLAELIAGVSKATASRKDGDSLQMDSFVAERDIDPDDWDKEGLQFCAYGTGYVVVDDTRNGFPVATPFKNVIYFQYAGSQRGNRNEHGEQELATFCTYTSHSKKEQQWLRDHKYFGLKIFESHIDALNVDAIFAQRLVKYIDSLMAQDQNLVIEQCKSYGIPISKDIRRMRVALAQKMALAAGDPNQILTEKRVKEKLEEDLFLGDTRRTTSESIPGRK